MSRAVQFDSYGGIDVLQVRDVPRPVPAPGEVLVEVKAAGINPSEAVIRSGALKQIQHEELENGNKEGPRAFSKIVLKQADSSVQQLHGTGESTEDQ